MPAFDEPSSRMLGIPRQNDYSKLENPVNLHLTF